ncbi:MAG: cell division protein PerM, partial [Aeromicrobium sp.]
MPHPTEPPYLRPAIGTALVSAFLGLLLTCGFVGLAQRGGSADSFADVFIAGVRTWLVSHGSGITVDDTTINAVPLGAVALAVVLVMWVAGRFLDQPLEEFGPFVAVTAGTYGVIAALLSAATNSGGLSTNMLRSTVVAVLVAAAGAALGVVRKNGGLRTLPFTDNADVRAILRAAWSGLVALLGAGLALFLVMFVLNIDRAGDLWAAIDPGLFGGLSLAVGCLIVIPNLALWATSALLGPGFSLGTDTSVDLTGAHLGAVPGLPLFAALPGPGVFPDWIFILGLLPLLAGGVAGWNLRTTAGRPLLERIALGAAAGAVAGLVCGILI